MINKKLKGLLANVKQEVIEYAFENEAEYETYYENAAEEGDYQHNSDLENGKAYDYLKYMRNEDIERVCYKIYHCGRLINPALNETVYKSLDTALEFLENCYEDSQQLDFEEFEEKYDSLDEDGYVEILDVFNIEELNMQVLFYKYT